MATASTPILRVGCAIWADRQWVGRYFPADTPPGRELVPYTTWCTAVEGNTTFYGLPSADTVARWGRSPTMFVHTPDNAVAPVLARQFHAEVRALRPELDPLPQPEAAAAQLRLPES